jgi:hypothetical protein
MMRYFATRRLVLGGQVHEPGQEIEVEPWMHVGPLLRRKFITAVPSSAFSDDAPPGTGPGEVGLTTSGTRSFTN